MSVTQIRKCRGILMFYCSVREAWLLIYLNLYQGFLEVSKQSYISRKTLTWDNGKNGQFLPSMGKVIYPHGKKLNTPILKLNRLEMDICAMGSMKVGTSFCIPNNRKQ